MDSNKETSKKKKRNKRIKLALLILCSCTLAALIPLIIIGISKLIPVTTTAGSSATTTVSCKDETYELFDGKCYKVFSILAAGSSPAVDSVVLPITELSCGDAAQLAKVDTDEDDGRVYKYVVKKAKDMIINMFNTAPSSTEAEQVWRVKNKLGSNAPVKTFWATPPFTFLNYNLAVMTKVGNGLWDTAIDTGTTASKSVHLLCQLY